MTCLALTVEIQIVIGPAGMWASSTLLGHYVGAHRNRRPHDSDGLIPEADPRLVHFFGSGDVASKLVYRFSERSFRLRHYTKRANESKLQTSSCNQPLFLANYKRFGRCCMGLCPSGQTRYDLSYHERVCVKGIMHVRSSRRPPSMLAILHFDSLAFALMYCMELTLLHDRSYIGGPFSLVFRLLQFPHREGSANSNWPASSIHYA